jgi:uncharacterized protein YbjT (DUF2867 family)
MKILFIGATGMLGKPVAMALLDAGHQVTLFGRDENKIRSLFPAAVVIKGDVFDKESLIYAMKGQQIVYMNLSVTQTSKRKTPQPEREGIDNIIAAAKQTGIQRLINLSSLVHRYEGTNGFHWWAFEIKHSAIQKIKASGIPYTIFYPSTFMETFPYQMMRGNKVALLGNSLMPMWFIAAKDYGKQVAASLAISDNANKEFAIQGKEAFTFEQATKIFVENYTKASLKIMKAPIGLMKFLGIFNIKFNYAWHICEALNKYPEKFESEESWKQLGKPSITLAEYANSL